MSVGHSVGRLLGHSVTGNFLSTILVLPSAIAIRAIIAINGCYGIYGNSHGTANMATKGIQGKSIEKLTQLCWFELNRTIPSKVMTV